MRAAADGSLWNINRHLSKHGAKILSARWEEIQALPVHETDLSDEFFEVL